jgi:hypothetical protein
VRHSRHRRPRFSGRAEGYARSARPAAGGGRPGSPARRALRLSLALGACVAAVGTVVAMVAAVVALGEGEMANPLSTANSGAGLPSVTSQDPGSGHIVLAAGVTVHRYKGPGAAHPRRLQISVPGTWGIYWSFNCPAGRQGTFAVKDTSGHSPGKLQVSASGKTGQGHWWNIPQPGYHDLLVISDCAWTARVVLPLVTHPSRQGHSHGHGGTHTPGPGHTPTTPPRPSPTPTPTPSPTPSPSPSPHRSPSPGPRHTHTPRPGHTPTPHSAQ